MVLIQPRLWRPVSQLSSRSHTFGRACSCASARTRAVSSRHGSETRYIASGSLDTDGSASTLGLGSYVALWFGTSCVFNILNKLTLNIFPMPLFLSTWQLIASSTFMIMLWTLGLHPKPKLPKRFLFHLLPVAFFHTVGHVAACVSFNMMAVSFTHVVKASEPVFTVALSSKLLGVSYSGEVASSLVCIILGVLVAAHQEVTFSWIGTGYAMASNLGMVLRGLYSRRCLQGFEGMDGINLFGLISLSSLIFCIPLSLLFESHAWPQAASAAVAALGSEAAMWQLLVAGGVFYHLYNQLSYMVLYQGISPVTFSVGNTMKRVAIIVTSVALFKNPVSLLSWVGSAAAVFGTYWYSAAAWRVRQQLAQ